MTNETAETQMRSDTQAAARYRRLLASVSSSGKLPSIPQSWFPRIRYYIRVDRKIGDVVRVTK